jgi:hypothetical protein
MSWKETFSIRLGPGALAGITLGRWLRVLRDNHFDIDPRYWARAALITGASVANSLFARWEYLRYGNEIRETKIEPPLFVLGLWRSGTTHLHSLLARDDRFAYPTFYDVLSPHTFFSTEKMNSRMVGALLPTTRPQDNMAMGISEPQEDEFALCSLTGRSYLMTLAFPRRSKRYERYLTLRDISPDELEKWESSLKHFVQKLAYKYRRPLILKSPGHTARIRRLLEMFPGAKFVHIHRNPFEVFPSARHAVLKLSPYWTLQRTDHADLDDDILRQYKSITETYFEERSLIPAGRLHEMSFAQLEADPLGELRHAYRALDLPEFDYVEPVLRRYVDSLATYKRNTFSELDACLRERIVREWRRSFDEWEYAV